MSYQALNLVIQKSSGCQIRLLGAAPNTPAEERSLRMSEFIAFTMGGIFGVVMMCCLQINRLSARKDVENEKPKRTDPVSSE